MAPGPGVGRLEIEFNSGTLICNAVLDGAMMGYRLARVGWMACCSFWAMQGAGCNRDGRCGAISQKSAFQGFIFCWAVPPVIKVCEYTCKTEMSGFFFCNS